MIRRGGARLLAALPLVFVPAHARAHAPIHGIGPFYNGVLHPVLAAEHVLLLIALGLLLGQHAPRLSRPGWVAFAAALCVGLVAGQGLGWTIPSSVLLALALIAGLLVALERSFGLVPVLFLAIAAGFGLGFDTARDIAGHGDPWPTLAGTALGGLIAISLIGGLAAILSRNWQRIGLRIAGSWVAASAMIVLVFAIAGPRLQG